jgi:hypothetical protein
MPLLAGLLLAVSACGGGGGGNAPGSTASTGATGAATALGTSASGVTAGATEVRYTMGPVTVANDTTVGYQSLRGMDVTADGGYRIVWDMAEFDSSGTLQRTYFEQRYDATGQRVGSETVLPSLPAGLIGDRVDQVPALGGGFLRFVFSNEMRASLSLQHVSDTGEPLDPAIELQAASHSHEHAGLRLPNDAIAIAWQPVSSVGPGELRTAVLTPGPR